MRNSFIQKDKEDPAMNNAKMFTPKVERGFRRLVDGSHIDAGRPTPQIKPYQPVPEWERRAEQERYERERPRKVLVVTRRTPKNTYFDAKTQQRVIARGQQQISVRTIWV
jgi:hypothetical protein